MRTRKTNPTGMFLGAGTCCLPPYEHGFEAPSLDLTAKQPIGPLAFTAQIDFTAAAAGPDGAAKRPTFTIKAYSGGPMRTNFSYYPVVLDLAGGKAGSQNIPILYMHDDAQPVGQSNEVKIDASGVSLTGSITGEDQQSKDILAHAANGFRWQASVGANVARSEFLEAGATATVNGQKFKGPMVIAREWTLAETSIVTIGADTNTTSVKIAATHHKGRKAMNPFQTWLQAQGIADFEKLSAPVQTQLRAAFDATEGDDNGGGTATITATDVEKIVAAAVTKANTELTATIKADYDRSAAIDRITASHPTIRAKAMTEKWTAERTELEVMRASRPTAPGWVLQGSEGVSADVLACALLQAGKAAEVDKLFKPEVLQAAHTRYRGRIGLQQVILEAAWAGGYSGQHFDKSASGLRDMLRAAFSTQSLPGIMSNVANKFMLAGFTGVDQSWRQIAATRPVSDFKAVTSYRLNGDFEFVELAPDGELEHASASEESFTNRAKTYGKMYAITRTDLINDDLGALNEIPKKIGRGGALKFNSVFWAAFLADAATFYSAAHGNYITGATTVLSIDGLTAAITKFMRQTDPDGKPLALTPTWLLVPPELYAAALSLMRSVLVNTGGSSTTAQVLNANIYSGRFPPIVSPYLTDPLAWYLGASPLDMPLIEAVFLNGVEQPTVESADVDFNQLGIQMRGYFDFGVAKQEYRAAIKSKGAA